ncbi:MAG TPA: type II CAAX endopeptidase family protein [Pyrinomonadaceae bacterium]|nr:type II CAAX endopeptidase family protein [Pyrinomonadaceae bacterium]
MTSNESSSLSGSFPETPGTLLTAPERPDEIPDPSNPPWGLIEALATWGLSVALLIIVPVLTLIPYVLYRVAVYGPGEAFRAEQQIIVLSIVGVLPAHFLTLGLAWLIVTNRGRRPFWKTLGWSWPRNFGPWKAIGLAVLLLGVGLLITTMVRGSETQLDQLIKSSPQARWIVAFLAVATAPLVEEVIYRGVLFAAFQKVLGTRWAVVIVSGMFLAVHILQYYNNLGVLSVIMILSVALTLVRAYTGSLLPCFVIHLVFNGIQSLVLLLQPWLERYLPQTRQIEAVQLVEGLVRHVG